MRRKCYLPKSFEELKNLPDEKLQFYWDTFYTYPMIGHKAKLRPLWYAIQCELGRCKLPEKYITRLERYANNPDKYIEHAHKNRYVLSIGTLLTKKYKGQIYHVTVKGEKEYEWEGKIYPNLTVIASAISKCHVSGPAFFGLMERKNAKS